MDADFDKGASPITFDARSLTLPATAIIAAVGAFVWGTFVIVGERERIDRRINNTITAIERLAVSVERLAVQQQIGTRDRWTRTEHDIWCSKAEKVNKNWVCPEIPVRIGGRLTNSEKTIRDAIIRNLRKDDD